MSARGIAWGLLFVAPFWIALYLVGDPFLTVVTHLWPHIAIAVAVLAVACRIDRRSTS